MANIIRLLERLNNGMNRFTVTVVGFVIIAAIGTIAWLLHSAKDDTISFGTDDTIDCTPTIIEHVKAIGQWEFLAINDEEIVDTMRTGFFSDDELARIYYGTLRIGIDFRDCSEDWIKTEGDTIYMTLPDVKLLDYNFIDEARTRSFFETGKWSNADRKAMYEKARQTMLKRCLTEETLNNARRNAKEQITRTLQPIAKPKTVVIKNDYDS